MIQIQFAVGSKVELFGQELFVERDGDKLVLKRKRKENPLNAKRRRLNNFVGAFIRGSGSISAEQIVGLMKTLRDEKETVAILPAHETVADGKVEMRWIPEPEPEPPSPRCKFVDQKDFQCCASPAKMDGTCDCCGRAFCIRCWDDNADLFRVCHDCERCRD